MATTTRAEQWIRSILGQGGDPRQYRMGIARETGMSIEQVDMLIASAGPVRSLSPAEQESQAERRLIEERRYRKTHPAEARARDHEED